MKHPDRVSRIRVMNSPSTVAENGDTVIMPLTKIHTTPMKGTIPSTRESTRIIGRKLPPLLLFLIDRLEIGIGILTPKLVTGAVDKNVFQRRFADRDGLNLARESLDNIGDEAM